MECGLGEGFPSDCGCGAVRGLLGSFPKCVSQQEGGDSLPGPGGVQARLSEREREGKQQGAAGARIQRAEPRERLTPPEREQIKTWGVKKKKKRNRFHLSADF